MGRAEERQITSEWDQLSITERPEGVRIAVQVRPKSSRSALLGVRNGALDVALMAPPVDGAANIELVKLLADVFEVRRCDVEIALGMSSRSKLVAVHGIGEEAARERLLRARR